VEGKGGPLSWSRKSVPIPFLPTTVSRPHWCASLPSSGPATASPPGGLLLTRAQQVKAAQVEERSGRGALVLALTLCYTGDPAREARYRTYA
jgi:hypothetical protein